MSKDQRLASESQFFDQVIQGGEQRKATRFYKITQASVTWYQNRIGTFLPNSRVLLYGCGSGHDLYWIKPYNPQQISGIDISPASINHAQALAEDLNLNNAHFQVMDAENLDYPEGHFDIIIGLGVLHHLNIPQSIAEINRVLSPQGHAFFVEPLAYNPIVQLYRRFSPNQRTPDEHPLKAADIEMICSGFGASTVRHYHFLDLITIPLMKTPLFKPTLTLTSRLDAALFSLLPPSRWLAWHVIMELGEPRKT